MRKSISFMILLVSMSANAQTNFDKTEELYGVSLKSAKEDTTRSYIGSIEKTLPFPMAIVKNGVTNFTERCNNDFKSKRKFTAEETNCKYHNEHLVESFVVRDIKTLDSFKDFRENYLVGRQVYNRGHFGFYDLVQVREGMNDKNQKTMTITLRMLEDEEVKALTELKITKDSAFNKSHAEFILTEIAPGQTHLNYSYTAQTDHWLLNKEISVPQVFASISKTINSLVKAVEDESSLQKRDLASK
jgi:hypothetical protein